MLEVPWLLLQYESWHPWLTYSHKHGLSMMSAMPRKTVVPQFRCEVPIRESSARGFVLEGLGASERWRWLVSGGKSMPRPAHRFWRTPQSGPGIFRCHGTKQKHHLPVVSCLHAFRVEAIHANHGRASIALGLFAFIPGLEMITTAWTRPAPLHAGITGPFIHAGTLNTTGVHVSAQAVRPHVSHKQLQQETAMALGPNLDLPKRSVTQAVALIFEAV